MSTPCTRTRWERQEPSTCPEHPRRRSPAPFKALVVDPAIESMREEAAEAGDYDLMDTCDAALVGDEDALAECDRRLADRPVGELTEAARSDLVRDIEDSAIDAIVERFCTWPTEKRVETLELLCDRAPESASPELIADARRVIETLRAEA